VQGYLGGKAGQSLVVVIMITSLLLILSSAAGAMVLRSYVNVAREEEYIKAQYAAEAGIETTIAALSQDTELLSNLLAVNDGVEVEVFSETPVSDQVTYLVVAKKKTQALGKSIEISSHGCCRDGVGALLAKKTLLCTVDIYGQADYLKGLAVLPGQSANLALPGNITVEGDMLCNGSVDLSETSLIGGDVYASGNVTGTCGGQIYSNFSNLPPFPALEENYYLQRALDDGHVFYHDADFGTADFVTDYSGFYYVDGNVNIFGEYQGMGLIFATGNIYVQGNLSNTSGNGSLTLVSLGDIDIYNFSVAAHIIAGGSLLVQEGAALQGAACVAGLTYAYAGEGILTICPALSSEPVEGALTAKVEPKFWRESRTVF